MPTLLKIVLVIALLILPMACGESDAEKSKAFMASGKFHQALELLNNQVAQESEDAEIQFLLGVALINLGQLQEGDERLANAVNLNSDYGARIGWEYKKAGDSALEQGRTGKAISLFQAAVRHQPDLKKNAARSFYEKGKDLSLAGKDTQAIEMHQYAMVLDPMLGKDIAKWYAVKAEKVESGPERIDLLLAASHFKTAYIQEAEKIQQAAAKEEAEKSAMSVRARMKRVIEQRLDQRAWERLADKSVKTIGNDETVEWSVKYYQKAGYRIKRLTLNDKAWIKIGKVANRSNMFFLSAKDFWYVKSSLKSPRAISAAITKPTGIQFYGDNYMDISIRTETPPHDVFYWVVAPNPN